MTRPTQAIIDLSALHYNLQRVRACATQQRIIAVIKANGYGHGAIRIANALSSKVEAFAVCCLEEALELRSAGIQLPILLLEGFYQAEELPLIVEQELQVVIHTLTQVTHLLKASLEHPISVWLKVDTGMHRLGFTPLEIGETWKRFMQCAHIAKPIRLMSHLSCADDRNSHRTSEQIQRFKAIIKGMDTETSLANSAGILGWPQTHYDWVRPGIMLYGVSPFIESVAKTENLQAVMQLQSVLISVKQHRQGDAIGYGATWRCPQAMPIGVVAIGYADGYPRHAPAGTPVLVNGRRVPLIGRVSMDMITVDLRSQPNARIGDPVILWGRNLPVEEVATHAGTISYELLCHVSPRVKRVENTLTAT
jgi:alanine racemase